MQLYTTKAVISVGEVKRSGSGYGEGLNQLKERIAVLEWAIKCVRPQVTLFVKAGHLYMPLGTIKEQQGPVENEELTIHPAACLRMIFDLQFGKSGTILVQPGDIHTRISLTLPIRSVNANSVEYKLASSEFAMSSAFSR